METIFGFNYALGDGFYLGSGLPISSPSPSAKLPVTRKERKKSRVGEYKTAESLGSAGVLNPAKKANKSMLLCGGWRCKRDKKNRNVRFRRAESIVPCLYNLATQTLANQKCYHNADPCSGVRDAILHAVREVLACQRCRRRRVARREAAVARPVEQILHGNLGHLRNGQFALSALGF